MAKPSIYDLIGCNYNMPAAYAPGVFESCEGDLQDEVGTYTANGTSKSCCLPKIHLYVHADFPYLQLTPGPNPALSMRPLQSPGHLVFQHHPTA